MAARDVSGLVAVDRPDYRDARRVTRSPELVDRAPVQVEPRVPWMRWMIASRERSDANVTRPDSYVHGDRSVRGRSGKRGEAGCEEEVFGLAEGYPSCGRGRVRVGGRGYG